MNSSPQIELNEVTEKLPKHLLKYIVKQPYNDYTAQNHAVWRYVLRMNIDSLRKFAHPSYFKGLEKAGISRDTIPNMDGIDRILKEMDWAAVSVNEFIPLRALLEFQSYQVLIVDSSLRNIEQVGDNFVSDIIHATSGHAPILSNPEYAEYLRRLGQIGSKAISSPKDKDLYEAIRVLTELKKNPHSLESDIAQAKDKVRRAQNIMGELSEMAHIRNLHWWSVEYGLIGRPEKYKFYGSVLLSSIEERKRCVSKNVRKLPYSIKTAKTSFDFLNPSPNIFVIPDFAYLGSILEDYANTMSLRRGGAEGLDKLIASKEVGTIELSSGIQISGVFTDSIKDENGKVIYFQTTGGSALADKNKELVGHGVKHHSEGFGSPIGKLKGIGASIENMTSYDLEAFEIYEGRFIQMDFEGGVRVEGNVLIGKRDIQGKVILISFDQAVVTCHDRILFQPDQGIYHMVIGTEIVSAYAGAADTSAFNSSEELDGSYAKQNYYSDYDLGLFSQYQKVKDMREFYNVNDKGVSEVYDALVKDYPNDWLLPLELYEISRDKGFTVFPYLMSHIDMLKQDPHKSKLIEKGMELLDSKSENIENNDNEEDLDEDLSYFNFLKDQK